MVSLEDDTKFLKYDVKVGSYEGAPWNMVRPMQVLVRQ